MLAGCGGALPQALAAAPAINVFQQQSGIPIPDQFLVLRRPGYGVSLVPRGTSGLLDVDGGYRIVHANPRLGYELVSALPGEDPARLERRLAADPGVAHVEPNVRLTVPAFALAAGAQPVTAVPLVGPGRSGPSWGVLSMPDDPLVAQQYALSKIHAFDAWGTSEGNGVTVAVLDSGVDENHPDLQGNLVQGYDATTGGSDPMDSNGHGTHVCGIIGAMAGNGIGGCGIAPHVRIMPIRVLDSDGAGQVPWVADGIQWAVDHGAKVINMSLGSPEDSQVLHAAINYALSRGVCVVGAMGNDGDTNNSPNYPAAYAGVIGVGATDANDRIANFSCYGSWISVAAPGWGIVSTFPTYDCELAREIRNDSGWFYQHGMRLLSSGYAEITGTSQATPFVSGTIALMLSRDPNLTPAQVQQRLEQTAVDVDGDGFDPHQGGGRIDAAAAIAGL